MRILFLGDIVGKPGRRAVERVVPRLIDTHNLALVVANCENVTDGSGVDSDAAQRLLASGIDVLTSGNHIWRRNEIVDFIEADDRLLRPLNYPPENPGKGWTVFETAGGVPVAVVNLIGRVFMDSVDCPFRAIDQTLPSLAKQARVIVVDMHGEATSEKGAMGWFLNGRVTAVLGSHTHVQTADERILPGGTAFITDAGMCGPLESVLGVDPDAAIRRFITHMPSKLEVAHGPAAVEGVVLEVEDSTGRALDIRRVHEVAE
jgi:metallophosphoesterase (TIGR00282 family)